MRAPLDLAPARPPELASPASAPAHHDAHAGTADWLLLLGPGLIWGASFLFIAEGLQSVGPNGLTFARILVGFVVLGLVPSARRPIAREDRRKVVLLGLIWLALPLSMFPFAEQRVSSALTGMLNGANPLFVAIVAAAFSRRLPGRDVMVGLAVGLGGTVLVALPSLSLGGSSLRGVLFILAGVTCYGFALNLARPLQLRNGALPVIWRAQAWALLMTAPLGVPELLRAQWAPGPLLSVLALGALGTGVAYVLLAVAAGRMGATRAAATTFLIPGVALLLGWLVRGEQVAALSIVGGVVCVGGAWLMRRAQLAAH